MSRNRSRLVFFAHRVEDIEAVPLEKNPRSGRFGKVRGTGAKMDKISGLLGFEKFLVRRGLYLRRCLRNRKSKIRVNLDYGQI